MGAVQRLPLDVDVLGPELEGARQNGVTVFLAPGKASAFPFRTAGGHHRHPAAVQGPGHVQIRHTVEAQLDQVSDRRGLAGGDQIGHRLAGDGLTQKRSGHKKTPPQPVG
jgi:hypothetical protein